MKEFIENHKLLLVLALAGVVLIMIIAGGVSAWKAERANEREAENDVKPGVSSVQGSNESDAALMKAQQRLIERYGRLPDGYLWDSDGTLLSQGDKSMSAEDVVYAYLNGIKTLDLSSAQRFSRKSRVVNTYEGYFDSRNISADYKDSFTRNVYRQCLLSMQINGIETSTVFAENKQVFTINATIIDLTEKEFWLKDKAEIYKALQIYRREQGDSTTADSYLYDYILAHYKSDNVSWRDVSFDLTVQRFPDLDTGWLVSIDSDIDMYCKNQDGATVVSYIKDKFNDEGAEYLAALELSNNTTDDVAE